MTYEDGEMHDETKPHSDADNFAKPTGGKRVEFPTPKGFVPPESDTDQFELVTTFERKPDGKTICIVKMGEFDMPGYKDGVQQKESIEQMEMKGEHAPDYKSYAKGMMDSMGENSQSPNSY